MEKWQVRIGDNSSESDLATIKKLIGEGQIHYYDLIKKGSLNWIEARRVPELRSLFPAAPELEASVEPVTDPLPSNSSLLHPIYFPDRIKKIFVAVCVNHQEKSPDYICSFCGIAYCISCTKLVGTANVAMCQNCGQLCHKYADAKQKAYTLVDKDTEFGTDDIILAFKSPLGYPLQLAFISGLFGIFMVFAFLGFPVATFLATGLIFVCTSVVIRRVMVGDLDDRHLFDLSLFLANPLHPSVIGAALLLVTTGPYEFIHFSYMVQAQDIFGVVFSKFTAFFHPIFNIYTVLAIIWAIFYYPIALLVAGITESFFSIINPLEGLRIIKRLGKDYIKIFLYYLCLLAMGALTTLMIVELILPTLIMMVATMLIIPIVNFFAVFMLASIVALPIFYTNMAIAYLLGRAIFKNAHIFDIYI